MNISEDHVQNEQAEQGIQEGIVLKKPDPPQNAEEIKQDPFYHKGDSQWQHEHHDGIVSHGICPMTMENLMKRAL